jgi:FkbM family methyltransferase
MTARQWIKYWLYGACGDMPYFGVNVHFPRGSSAFRRVCGEGIFEHHNVRVLQELCAPGTWMFDVGAHLGMMAVPVLSSVHDSIVVSFEPSPNALPWLRRTITQSGFGSRWRLIETAVAAAAGKAEFSVSIPTEGMYDGLIHTNRVTEANKVTVEVTTLDLEWKRLDRPAVSVIKIDVEGGEFDVLRGASDCLASARPFILLEWAARNLAAYRLPCDALFELSQKLDYGLYALPNVIPINSASDLDLQVRWNESFLMAPSIRLPA